MQDNSFPKISIVTPSYNQGQYIEQTILSIINQGYPNLEYIIIDGGSTDNTVDIIKKYADRITYWVSEPDKGQSDAINKGIKKCTGEIFNWINSDDYLEEGALLKIGEAFMSNPKLELVCAYSNIFDDATGTTILQHRCEFFESVEKTIVQQKINQQGLFYRMDILRNLGGINQTLHYVMDLELWFRYLSKFGQTNVMLLNDVVAHFRIHLNSKTSEFEERFRKEERGLFFHLLRQKKIDKGLLSYFEENVSYQTNEWDTTTIDKEKLVFELCSYHFFGFYKKNCFAATRTAFIYRIRNANLPLNRHIVRMFIKSFIGV